MLVLTAVYIAAGELGLSLAFVNARATVKKPFVVEDLEATVLSRLSRVPPAGV